MRSYQYIAIRVFTTLFIVMVIYAFPESGKRSLKESNVRSILFVQVETG